MPQPDFAFVKNTEGTIKDTCHQSNMCHCTPSFSLPFTTPGNFYLSCNSFFFLKVNVYTPSLQKYLLNSYSMPGLALGTGDSKSRLSQSISSSSLSHFQLVFYECKLSSEVHLPRWLHLVQADSSTRIVSLSQMTTWISRVTSTTVVKGGVLDGNSHESGLFRDINVYFSFCF